MATTAASLHLRSRVALHTEEGTPLWRRNLAALWCIEFVAVFGFNFATPFLPLFLSQDLGLRATSDIALWSGLAAGGVGIAMAVASPIWGVIADRRGRKTMLLRAIAGGAVSVGLMAVAQTPGQLFALCIVQGASSGTVAAATALVACETPRKNVVHALSVLSSAVALGGALAPVAGGALASLMGLRFMFLISGVLLAAALIPALLVVGETRRPATGDALPSKRSLSGLAGGTLALVLLLVGAQALMQFSSSATGALVVLRAMRIVPGQAATIAGIGFGLAGTATTLASLSYERVLKRAGYRRLASAAAVLLAATVAAAAVAGSPPALVLAIAAGGLFYGALNPLLYSLIGLQTPAAAHGTVYGISASALALGSGAGPILTGLVAATISVQTGLLVAALAALVLAVLLWARVREPVPA